MRREQVNRLSARALVVLALAALLTVLGALFQPPRYESDEGTGAHLFQLSIAALAPALLAFLATADWSKPVPNARPLALPAVLVALAFGLLFYLEHLR